MEKGKTRIRIKRPIEKVPPGCMPYFYKGVCIGYIPKDYNWHE